MFPNRVYNDTLVVIAHHNGSAFLTQLVSRLYYEKLPIVVVDTGSTEEEFNRIPNWYTRGWFGEGVERIEGGYCIAAYEHAYRKFRYPHYLFLHDSMQMKENCLHACRTSGKDVVSWLGFNMDYGEAEKDYLSQYGLDDLPARAIFGPIFYASRQAMEKIDYGNLFPRHPKNRTELCASERAYAIAFHRAGIEIGNLEEYDNERIDMKRDYQYFDKYRPNRD
jgi:hypothetical protein